MVLGPPTTAVAATAAGVKGTCRERRCHALLTPTYSRIILRSCIGLYGFVDVVFAAGTVPPPRRPSWQMSLTATIGIGLRAGSAFAPGSFIHIEGGHLDVHQYEIGMIGFVRSDAGLTVPSLNDRVPRAGEKVAQYTAQIFLVLDDQSVCSLRSLAKLGSDR